MAVRKVVTRRGHRVRGYMPSLKMGRHVEWESQHELELYRILELSGCVKSYDVQPSVEVIHVNGVEQIYFPDVEVTYLSGRKTIIEVKPSIRLKTPKVAARMQAFTEKCRATNREFYVVTEEVIRKEPRRTAVEELMYHRHPLNSREKFFIQTRLQEIKPTTVSELRKLLGPELADLALGNGIVGVNLDTVLTEQSEILLVGGHIHENLHP